MTIFLQFATVWVLLALCPMHNIYLYDLQSDSPARLSHAVSARQLILNVRPVINAPPA